MAYCVAGDLLLGDLVISASVDKNVFIQEAADEIDSKLGFIYKLPLAPPGTDPVTPDSWKLLPHHEVLTLKTINVRLATGRLILTLDIAGQETQLHAYGWYLIKEALDDLMIVANGNIDLTATRVGVEAGYADATPRTSNHDDESLLAGFENTIMRGRGWYTRPGEIP